MTYQLIEHTADIGIKVEAGSLTDLFKEAAKGLFSTIGETVDDGTADPAPAAEHHIEIAGTDREELFVNWLNELLFLFETEYILFNSFQIHSLNEESLTASVSGEYFTPDTFDPDCDPKAVTYSGISIQRNSNGCWQTEFIIDI